MALSVGVRARGAAAVGGGCISPAWKVALEDGSTVFVKEPPPGADGAMLPAEADALGQLRAAGAVRVPKVLGVGSAWLVLEWLEPGEPGVEGWRRLGRELAALHRCTAPAWGWHASNFIGSLPQRNERSSSWAAFWWEHRLQPQLELAAAAMRRSLSMFEELHEQLDEVLQPAEHEGPSLLHGDMWRGNVHPMSGGAALIDPCTYHGHREVDLAMAALFGGLPAACLDAYAAEWPLLPGWERRRAVYQLYYLLVHVNLFGGSYVAGTESALRAAVSGADRR